MSTSVFAKCSQSAPAARHTRAAPIAAPIRCVTRSVCDQAAVLRTNSVTPSHFVASRRNVELRAVVTEERENTPEFDTADEIHEDSYVCMGMAQCFMKSNGTLTTVDVIEPMSASSLECLANGARTSYKMVTGVSLGDAYRRNRAALPEAFANARFCENFDYRLMAAARTWARPHAQDNLMDIVPLGKSRSNFNFSLEDKRVLNMENVVNDNDNIKQDLSIDVYGRKKTDEYAQKTLTEQEVKQQAQASKQQQVEADLDTLLMA